MGSSALTENPEAIAVVGMACRFPGARDTDEFWRNLREGVESITPLSAAEVDAEPAARFDAAKPNYVRAAPILEDVEGFDAAFFDITPREAEFMDPQHRLFLECSWQAMERAGYDPNLYPGRVGVFGGTGISGYLIFNICSRQDLVESLSDFRAMIQQGNDKDYLTTRVSYKLNLRGPSINVQTTCSTSLVAVNLACQSLLTYQCDMALAGGVSVRVPHRVGYLYQEGGILSPDGHCRAFSARAAGTLFGSGAGVILLKRLRDAVAEGDHIHAVIRGSAVNNDGSLKVGYTAPGVEGQAEVIAEALALAGVDARTVRYVEAHGTGTTLGDPVEVAALAKAFGETAGVKRFCALGSVKTNFGHLDTAAGVAGLIKTALALEHRMLPPTLHFDRPNPAIDFENSPFYVNTTLREWEAGATPRRAGVSSFGIGGTNAHVVLEEAPPASSSGPARPFKVLVLSAKTGTALEAATRGLAAHLERHPEGEFADAAYTLQVGRRAFAHRRALVCRDREEALALLASRDAGRVFTSAAAGRRRVAFLFPGQNSQYVGMAEGLYRSEPFFRKQLDACAKLLLPELGLDVRGILYPEAGGADEARMRLNDAFVTQPTLFAVEYSLASLLMEWGVVPHAMLGHSIGEYVAACLAGVMSLEDALSLLVKRGRLLCGLSGGRMLAVQLSEQEVSSLLGRRLSLAAVNGPAQSVVAGLAEDVTRLERRLAEVGVACKPLGTSHAFHSAQVDPLLGRFAEEVGKFRLHSPRIPYLSNVTGTWVTAEQATDPQYWAAHLRQTVRFADSVAELLKDDEMVLLEVGPGRTLTSLTTRHPRRNAKHLVLASARHRDERQPDSLYLLNALALLWLAGVPVNWSRFSRHERRRRVPLPTYPFERQRHWFEPQSQQGAHASAGKDEAMRLFSARPRADAPAAAEGPASDIERAVAEIWRQMLGVSDIGPRDNFFELGGDSLLGTQLISRLREAFPVEFSLDGLFASPTVAGIAEVIEELLIQKLEALPEEAW
jgi:acyl transferase domain-containing protein